MTDLKTLLFGTENRIGRRLIVLIIAFSSLITLALSAVQLAVEYRDLRNGMERELDGVGIHLPSIAGSVWDFDERQVRLALEALAQLPNVDRVSVTTSDVGTHWVAGKSLSRNIETRIYPLKHLTGGREREIGKLEVVASLDGIYRQIAARALTIVASNGLKTFLVAIFMYYLFRRLVTGRIEQLADRMRRLIPALRLPGGAADSPPAPVPAHLDELATVDWVLETRSRDLGIAVAALQHLNEDLERRVKERTLALTAANEELEAFGYSLSHDLRTPLRAMAAFSTILQEDYADRLDEDGRRHLARIVAAAARMDILIGDTLSLFKVSASRFQRQTLDLARIAGDIAEELARSDPARVVEWKIDKGIAAEGDPGLVRTALENLIGNAWKYTGKRQVAQISIGTSHDPDGNAAYFIADNGTGFDMSLADRLFTPFHRLHRQDEFPGSGIGLATVQKIIHRHGGRIWAESAPEQGARFFFTLSPG